MSLATTSEPKRLSSPGGEGRRSEGSAHGAAASPALGEVGEPAEHAVGQQHDDGDQQQADPEIPVLRGDAGELVARHHEDDGADQPAVEPAGAAQHQDDQRRRRSAGSRARRATPSRWSAPARRRRCRRSRRRWCRPCGYATRLGAPMAGMRTGFSRMPRRERPNGEWMRRRTARNTRNSTHQRVGVGRVAVEIEREEAEQLARCARPAGRRSRRSASSALLAASCSRKPRPMVIMISARWRKRATMKLVA